MIDFTVPPYLHTISIPTPFPVGPVNVYLAEGDPLTLVDVGPLYDPARESLEKALVERGCRIADLQRVIVTHAHSDHYGLAAEVKCTSGAEVLAHAASVPWLEKRANTHRLAFYAQVMRWAGVPVKALAGFSKAWRSVERYDDPVTPDGVLADGDLLRLGDEDWQVLHTPGHASGLLCLYQPQRRLLISSDHLLRDISSNPVIEPPAPGETGRPRRLVTYMAQLQRVAELDVALALPGHGLPITDPRALIGERLAFHEVRARRMLEVLGDDMLTTHEIAGRLFTDLDPVNYFLALSEVIGHLQWLEVEGQAAHAERSGIALWRALS
ncbi:MAG: MBL fold metallo-hydrolase [Chloroflexota bacterium]|nr:MBL fold metallo-hydrolase [Chloroflexota bacterium]